MAGSAASESHPTLAVWALWLSVAAFVVSGLTTYYTVWRGVSLEMEVDREIRVGNAMGGIPSGSLTMNFWGNGASQRVVAVSRTELQLTRVSDGTNYTLKGSLGGGGPGLPLMVEGGTGRSFAVSFAADLYAPELADKYKDWFDHLESELPNRKSEIDSLRVVFSRGRSEQMRYFPWDGEVRYDVVTTLGTLGTLTRDDPQTRLKLLLSQLDAAGMKRVVFVVPGRYRATVRVLGQRQHLLFEQTFVFDVESSYADALRSDYTVSVRAPLQEGESTAH